MLKSQIPSEHLLYTLFSEHFMIYNFFCFPFVNCCANFFKNNTFSPFTHFSLIEGWQILIFLKVFLILFVYMQSFIFPSYLVYQQFNTCRICNLTCSHRLWQNFSEIIAIDSLLLCLLSIWFCFWSLSCI